MPSVLIRPCVGLSPTRLQTDAGLRTDPPLSDPRENDTMPAATWAADPPLEPLGEYRGFQGFF